ncbi:MAG: DUF2842 domain-containing protein [Bauldia sp.]|uniref:DUF2842 domain-containing protein n=1 Tax=Bauldia sp. TaxID=2575872 RepID=UPI001DFFD92C|nr:DUF2842 domain-containing protein [Bauldia sp.]MCB1494939.1 DUF2842 domain-containing protein [Bauldia sp.]
MRRRTRKLIGTVTLMLFVPFYALVAMSVASARLADASVLGQTVFFVIAGLIWLVPAGAIIWWMERPESPR